MNDEKTPSGPGSEKMTPGAAIWRLQALGTQQCDTVANTSLFLEWHLHLGRGVCMCVSVGWARATACV